MRYNVVVICVFNMKVFCFCFTDGPVSLPNMPNQIMNRMQVSQGMSMLQVTHGIGQLGIRAKVRCSLLEEEVPDEKVINRQKVSLLILNFKLHLIFTMM